MSQEISQEYKLSVRTNDVRTAISQTAGALYDFIEEALQTHEEHEAEECEFELFARDVLGVLSRHADQLAELEGSGIDDPDDPDLPPEDLVED